MILCPTRCVVGHDKYTTPRYSNSNCSQTLCCSPKSAEAHDQVHHNLNSLHPPISTVSERSHNTCTVPGELTSPSRGSSLRLAGRSLESLAARVLLPAFLPLPPPLSPQSLTFNQMDYQQKWSLRVPCQSNIFIIIPEALPDA